MSKTPYLGPKGTEALMRIMKDNMGNCSGGDGSLNQDLEFTVDPITGELMLSSKYEIANLEVRDGYLIMTNVNGDRTTFRPMGEYDPETEYKRGDLVYYDNSGWVVMTDKLVGMTPVNDQTNYMLLVKGGKDGVDGKDGRDGIDGKDGSDAAVVNPNLLINWDFRNAVNRNRKTEYVLSNWEYCIDCWRANSANSVEVSVKIGTDGLTLKSSNIYGGIYQELRNIPVKAGDKLTFSAMFFSPDNEDWYIDVHFMSGGDAAENIVTRERAEFNLINDQLLSCTVTIPDTYVAKNGDYFKFFICSIRESTNQCTVVASKCELGDKQTLAHLDEEGNWALNEIPMYEEQYALCRQYNNGVWVGIPVHSNPNLLLNPDFRKPVNTNGKTEYINTGYTIDCWLLSSAEESVSVKLLDSGLEMSQSGNVITELRQYINDPSRFAGQTMTLSFLFADDVSDRNVRISDSPGFAKTHKDVSVKGRLGTWTFVVSDNPIEDSYVDTWLNSGTVVILAAKLEVGSVQTLAYLDDDGEWALIDPPNYDLQCVLCNQYSPATGEWIGTQRSNPNLIVNWYLADPINQKTLIKYITTNAILYGPDMWRLSGPTALELVDGGFKLSATAANGHSQLITSIAEDFHGIADKWITISALTIDGKLYTASGRVPTSVDIEFYTVTSIAIPDAYNFAAFIARDSNFLYLSFNNINTTGNESLSIAAVKVELGAVQTLCHLDYNGKYVLTDPPPNKADQLTKCQRYMLSLVDVVSRDRIIGIGYSIDANYAYISIPVPTTMRAKPTFSIIREISTGSFVSSNDVNSCFELVKNGVAVADAIISIQVIGVHGNQVYIKVRSANLTANQFCVLRTGAKSTLYDNVIPILDANL